MTRQNAMFQAWLVVLGTIACCYLFSHPFYANCDEDGIRAMLEGRMSIDGKPLSYMVWVNVLVGYPLAALYRIWPDGYWYDAYLVGCLAISAMATLYLLLRRLPDRASRLTSAIIIAISLAIAIIGMTFSLTSALLLIAGWLWFLDAFRRADARIGAYAPAMALLSLSALTRIDNFQHMLPILALASLPLLMGGVPRRQQVKQAVLALLILLAAVALAALWDHRWSSDGIAEFWRFNTLRSALSDFFNTALMNDPAALAAMQKAGWTQEQFTLLNNWFFYNADVFTNEHLQRLIDAFGQAALPFRGTMPYPPMVDLQRYYLILFLAMPLLSRRPLQAIYWLALGLVYLALYMLTTLLYKLPPGYVVTSLALTLLWLGLYAQTAWWSDQRNHPHRLPRGLGIIPLAILVYILSYWLDDARRYDRRVALETAERTDMLAADDATLIITWGPMYVYARPFERLPDLPGRTQLNGAAFVPIPHIRELMRHHGLDHDFEKQLCQRDDIAVLGNLDADRAVPELERFIAQHYGMQVRFERTYDGQVHRLYRCRIIGARNTGK